MSRKLWPALAASAVLAAGVAACGGSDGSASASGASGTIAGAGSSAQQAAQEAWVAKFEDRELGRDDLV